MAQSRSTLSCTTLQHGRPNLVGCQPLTLSQRSPTCHSDVVGVGIDIRDAILGPKPEQESNDKEDEGADRNGQQKRQWQQQEQDGDEGNDEVAEQQPQQPWQKQDGEEDDDEIAPHQQQQQQQHQQRARLRGPSTAAYMHIHLRSDDAADAFLGLAFLRGCLLSGTPLVEGCLPGQHQATVLDGLSIKMPPPPSLALSRLAPGFQIWRAMLAMSRRRFSLGYRSGSSESISLANLARGCAQAPCGVATGNWGITYASVINFAHEE
ncbi:hypothetical protein DFH27DRAFT_529214 [Peziza echinospora]|nr:hypothetical protein DFH27DRAFT_529214 [Peziza echinospora]